MAAWAKGAQIPKAGGDSNRWPQPRRAVLSPRWATVRGEVRPEVARPGMRAEVRRKLVCRRAKGSYQARTYRQTWAPVLALAVDASVNGIAFPSLQNRRRERSWWDSS